MAGNTGVNLCDLGQDSNFLDMIPKTQYHSPSLSSGDTFQACPSGCLKPWILPDCIYAMFFPVYTYLWLSLIDKLGTVKILTTVTNNKVEH